MKANFCIIGDMVAQPLVILEGFHVCKHAVRYNAPIAELVTADKVSLEDMLANYAPDITNEVLGKVQVVSRHDFDTYSNILIRTPLAGKAQRVHYSLAAQVFDQNKPVVLLDNPKDLENIGAVVRVAAGMDAGAVLVTGEVDPWHKNCLRGAQGLHYAVPVAHSSQAEDAVPPGTPVVVFDESGQELLPMSLPGNAVFVFGSERQGVSQEWIDRADIVVRIPQAGYVSSYNLATSVAMALYHEKLTRDSIAKL